MDLVIPAFVFMILNCPGSLQMYVFETCPGVCLDLLRTATVQFQLYLRTGKKSHEKVRLEITTVVFGSKELRNLNTSFAVRWPMRKLLPNKICCTFPYHAPTISQIS